MLNPFFNNNNNLPGQFYVPTSYDFWNIPLSTLLKMFPRGQRTLLPLNFFKKILGRIFFLKCSAKRVLFLLHQMLSLFSTISLVYIYIYWRSIYLERIIQTWIISFNNIDFSAFEWFIVENRGNIWCDLMHMKKV